jgi:hypothetical protein
MGINNGFTLQVFLRCRRMVFFRYFCSSRCRIVISSDLGDVSRTNRQHTIAALPNTGWIFKYRICKDRTVNFPDETRVKAYTIPILSTGITIITIRVESTSGEALVMIIMWGGSYPFC